MLLRQLFDPDTSTYTYLLADPKSKKAALIDTVHGLVDRDLQLIEELGLKLEYVLETHVHADHITGAAALRAKTGAKTVASPKGPACADVHVKDGDVIRVGDVEIKVLETPGHTDDSLSYVAADNIFTGDALLIRGCGRTDFQNGDAGTLYDSLTQKVFELPETTNVWPGHDYKGRTVSTVYEEKNFNPRLSNKSKAEFVAIMDNLNLPPPKYINIAVPANRVCGAMQPTMHGDGFLEIQTLKEAAGARLIDVREHNEWNGELGHVDAAELVPLATLESAAKNWDRDQFIVLICRSGGRSGRAALTLQAMGFDKVASLHGGMIKLRGSEDEARFLN